MSEFELVAGLFLYPTPVGAYYAMAAAEMDKSRKFINNLLIQKVTAELTVENLKSLMDEGDEDKAIELLHHCYQLGWVQGLEQSIKAPQGMLEDILPELLNKLAENGKVLLADDQGFYLASTGFQHEVAEELSGLSAEILTVHKRRSGLLINNLGIASHAWAIVDPMGNSEIGFWPIFVGKQRFVLVIEGVPHFKQTDFVTLAWALNIRYAK